MFKNHVAPIKSISFVPRTCDGMRQRYQPQLPNCSGIGFGCPGVKPLCRTSIPSHSPCPSRHHRRQRLHLSALQMNVANIFFLRLALHHVFCALCGSYFLDVPFFLPLHKTVFIFFCAEAHIRNSNACSSTRLSCCLLMFLFL